MKAQGGIHLIVHKGGLAEFERVKFFSSLVRGVHNIEFVVKGVVILLLKWGWVMYSDCYLK